MRHQTEVPRHGHDRQFSFSLFFWMWFTYIEENSFHFSSICNEKDDFSISRIFVSCICKSEIGSEVRENFQCAAKKKKRSLMTTWQREESSGYKFPDFVKKYQPLHSKQFSKHIKGSTMEMLFSQKIKINKFNKIAGTDTF